MSVGLIKSFLEHASAKGTKATVLKPLGWMSLILISAILACYSTPAPAWLGIMFSIFFTIIFILYVTAYTLCLFTDRDALRSESFTIQKMALEKGFIGDNLTGEILLNTPSELSKLGIRSGSEGDK